METQLDCFQAGFRLEKTDPLSYSPLALAYIGDAVYELAIRTLVMSRGNRQVSKMHRETASLVKAGAQAGFYLLIAEELTKEEQAVYRRGRNAKAVTVAKHATMKDYRMATGFEALMGYLYLSGQTERMTALLQKGLEQMGQLPQEGQPGREEGPGQEERPGREEQREQEEKEKAGERHEI